MTEPLADLVSDRPAATPQRVEPAQPAATTRLPGSPVVVAAMAVVAACLAALLHEQLFRNGSINNDEVVYALQARLIASGHLLLHVPSPTAAYQPWFFAPGPHGLVPKYWPTVGALFGLSVAVTGSLVPMLMINAALTPVLVYNFGKSLLSRGRILLVTGLVTFSPLILIQSAMVLSYLPFMLMTVGLWWLCRGVRSRASWRLGACLGALFVVSLATRPFDTVLLGGPPAVFVLVDLARRRQWRAPSAGFAGGAAPLLVLMLAYDRYATGSVTRLPFNLLEPADRLGFGERKLFPEDALHYFGPLQGFDGIWRHFLLAPLTWYAAGALVLPLAIVAVTRWRRLSFELRALATAALCFLVGYFCYWGPFNASVLWGGPGTIGPFYAGVLLVPLALLAGSVTTVTIPRYARVAAVPALVLALLASGLQLGASISRAATQSTATTTVINALGMAERDGSPVYFEGSAPYLGHPVSDILSSGTAELTVFDASLRTVPSHGVLFQLPDDPYRPGGPTIVVSRLKPTTGSRLEVSTSYVGAAPAGTATRHALLVDNNAVRVLCPIDASGDAHFSIDASRQPACTTRGLSTAGLAPERTHCVGQCLRLTVVTVARNGALHRLVTRDVSLSSAHGRTTVVGDGSMLYDTGANWFSVQVAAR